MVLKFFFCQFAKKIKIKIAIHRPEKQNIMVKDCQLITNAQTQVLPCMIDSFMHLNL
jgi:hypothetical protein